MCEKLFLVVCVALMVACVGLSQGAIIMEDGLEAAENLAGNGWVGSWNFSGGNFGNPANYMWSAGDKGTVTKDTGYVIQSGDDLVLVFDIKDMDGEVATGEQVIGTLFYNNDVNDVVLGSVGYDDGDVASGWNNGLGELVVTATAESVGRNLQVSFEYTYSGAQQRFGIDNVVVSEGLPDTPATFAPYNDGDWSVIGTWGSDQSGSWGPATSVPQPIDIVICDDKTVSLDIDSTIASLSVDVNAADPNLFGVLNADVADKTLTVTGGATVNSTLNISAGTVLVEGDTLINEGGLIELSDGTFEPKGLLIIRSGGVFRQTGGSSVLNQNIAQNGGGLNLNTGGLLEISGGTLLMTSRSYQTGTVRIIGDEPTITTHQTQNTDFEFIFNETGVSKIHNDSWGDLGNSHILVDANDYTGEGGDFILSTGGNGVAIGSYEVLNLGEEGVDWTLDANAATLTITLTILSKTATVPSPAVGETVYGDGDAPVLSWRASSTAVAYDVYFDTVNPPTANYIGRQTATSYDPNLILTPGIYYWQVDAVEDPNDPPVIYEGDVWNFIISTGAASKPIPEDDATDVATDVTLTWTPGNGAQSHDVWFGKSADALELVADDITVAEYTPSLTKSLIKGMTYYWAVDEFDGTNTHPSPVFSFTVTPATKWLHFTNGDAGSNLWTSEANWDSGVPGVGSQPYLDASIGACLIDDTVDAFADGGWLRVGVPTAVDPTAYADDPTLEMTGGDLYVPRIALGNAGPGVINMTGGTMNVPLLIMIGDQGNNAMFNMDGGTINTGSLSFVDNTGVKTFNLNGGTVNATSISLTQSYTLNIGAGTLILNGDATGTINDGVTSGSVIAYDGTGKVFASYDTGTDKTTVFACTVAGITDITGDCAVDMDDLELLVADWLFDPNSTPQAWSFDMASDPVGVGIYDLNVNRQADGAVSYAMGNDTGTGTLEILGEENTLLDSQFPIDDRNFDTTINYVVKSTSADPVHLWFTMAMPGGGKSYVGISVNAVNGQTVEIWTGGPPHFGDYDPVVATGFNASDYLDITVNYNYDTRTFDWSVSDDGSTQSGTDVAYTGRDGTPGHWTIHSATYAGYGPGSALIDQLDITVDGSFAEVASSSAADIQPDGSVNLLDFAAIAEYWMVGP